MSLMSQLSEIARVLSEFRQILPVVRYKLPGADECKSLGSMFEQTVADYSDSTMLLFEGRQWTYAEFNREVNQLAHLLQSRGVNRGDCVALFLENRAEFLMGMLALAKLGAPASLINHGLSGSALVHCLRETGAKKCIVGAERAEVLAEVKDELKLEPIVDYLWLPDRGDESCPDWAEDAAAAMGTMPVDNLAVTGSITAGETALYIFTSGTTGLPKAAVQLHRKILTAGQVMGKIGFRLKPTDRLYLCLPIYHITGLGPGFCGFISAGASIFLRRNFSASNFWPEVQRYQTNSFIYVGELCRYLINQPQTPEERDNPLEKMLGNGLRPDVWDKFKERFGIQRISEIYGSSEGNVAFLNLLNKDKTIGATTTKVALVKYDLETDEIIRDSQGRCIEVPFGEPGLLLGEIGPRTEFDGYTNPQATAKKLVTGVLKEGDRWFNTGDMVRQIDVGFALGLKHFQFVDRVGDTFRWRAENVSTNEVAEVLNTHPQINMANVYGVEVPGIEGRAGMVAFELEQGQDLDVDAFEALTEAQLPSYAQPVFIRVMRSVATTSTFKLLKTDLREQAYHPDQVNGDTLYVRKPRGTGYELLDTEFYQQIMDSASGY